MATSEFKCSLIQGKCPLIRCDKCPAVPLFKWACPKCVEKYSEISPFYTKGICHSCGNFSAILVGVK